LGKKFFVSDCEGPISTNDNAFELAGHFIEDGEKFFQIVSHYDDILVDEIKRPGYNAGSTLKLILPFLKVYGATNLNMMEFSSRNVLLIPGARDTLRLLQFIMPSYIVSTSYEPYIRALCDLTNFSFDQCYCTRLDLDSHPLSEQDKDKLKEFRSSIVSNPEFDNLERIFWEEIPGMEIGSLLEEVIPVGGEAKKEAVLDIIAKNSFHACDLMYVGDSITDVEPLKYANENGGIALSFNGNDFALNNASLAVISDNTVITSIIADLFNRYNRDLVLEFAASFEKNPEKAVKEHPVNPQLAFKLAETNTRLELVTADNLEELKEDSCKFRKEVRGESIGGLG
jgi:energy-converting hydrogenase A subunit R